MAARVWLLVCWLAVLQAADSATFYADNGLDQTLIYRSLAKRERREMQQEILSLLGLHHRPKPKTHGTQNSAPRYLLDLYKSFLDEDSGNLKVGDEGRALRAGLDRNLLTNNSIHAINDSDVIMSFVNRIQHHAPHLRHDRDRRFWFDVSEVSPEENIIGSELRIYRNTSRHTIRTNASCILTLFSMSHGDDPEEKVLTFVDDLTVPWDQEGWLVLNATEPTITWVAFPHRNQGLYLRISVQGTDRDVHPHEIGLVSWKGSVEQQPFMVTFFKTPTHLHIRRTRATKKKQRSDISHYTDQDHWANPYNGGSQDSFPSKRNCQKRTLYVSFRDLGWQDWIIAPDGYAAFYCHGECSFPLNQNMNATNHAIVQTLVHLMDPKAVPKPCCAPTKLTAIMVLYFDDNSNVILKKYKNMVVKSCGCH